VELPEVDEEDELLELELEDELELPPDEDELPEEEELPEDEPELPEPPMMIGWPPPPPRTGAPCGRGSGGSGSGTGCGSASTTRWMRRVLRRGISRRAVRPSHRSVRVLPAPGPCRTCS